MRDDISDAKSLMYFLYFALLNLHRWFNITNIIPHSTDDGSLEQKHYSVDFASQWISPSTWITLLSIFLYILIYKIENKKVWGCGGCKS